MTRYPICISDRQVERFKHISLFEVQRVLREAGGTGDCQISNNVLYVNTGKAECAIPIVNAIVRLLRDPPIVGGAMKHAELIKAAADGKLLQWRTKGAVQWNDYEQAEKAIGDLITPQHWQLFEYRVHPGG